MKNLEMCKKKNGRCSIQCWVESLIYAMVAMRAVIAFAISMVSQFMSKAGPPHWMAVKHIMRYLKGTLDFKLCLKSKDIALREFCDANWTGDANTGDSPWGTCFLLALKSFSTTEAKYMALAIVRRKRFGLGNFCWM